MKLASIMAGMVLGTGLAAAAGAPEPARRAEIVQLVRQDCGSCHGLTLRGGLGPPLTAPALAGQPAAGLQATILYGRGGTPMAPWRPFLSEDEVAWLVETLQRGALDAD